MRITNIIKTLLSAAILFIISAKPAAAQTEFGFAVWNVDRLYDTIPSPHYNDSDYTPQGRLHWNSARYERKVAQTAAVLDSMALPVVALCGIENEAVARDIAARCRGEYSCIHRTLNTRDGLEFALLYYADMFFVSRVGSGYDHITVEGSIGDEEWAFILCLQDDEIPATVRQLRRNNHNINIVIAGNVHYADLAKSGLRDITEPLSAAGYGNALFRNGWKMTERIAVSDRVTGDCRIFLHRGMLDAAGAPAATFNGRLYKGGVGRRLPVISILKTE